MAYLSALLIKTCQDYMILKLTSRYRSVFMSRVQYTKTYVDYYTRRKSMYFQEFWSLD